MKKLIVMLLFCLTLTGCSTNEVQDSVSDNSISTNEEVVNNGDGTITTTTTVVLEDGSIFTDEYTTDENVILAEDKEIIEHVAQEGGEDIVVEQGLPEDVMDIGDSVKHDYGRYEEGNTAVPTYIFDEEEVKFNTERLKEAGESGKFDLQDAIHLCNFRKFITYIYDFNTNEVIRVGFPLVRSNNIMYKYITSDYKEVNTAVGSYDWLYLDKIYAGGNFAEYMLEYEGYYLHAKSPITLVEFIEKYKPYCELIQTQSDDYYYLKNNVQDYKASLTIFYELSNGDYLPFSVGNKIEELDESSIQYIIPYLENMVSQTVESADNKTISW